MEIGLVLDKLGDFSVLACIGVITWAYHMKKNMDIKINNIELDLLKNYVTKNELKRVEEKLDNMSEHVLNKIDHVNNNILLILQKN